jgi:hypothetical protein
LATTTAADEEAVYKLTFFERVLVLVFVTLAATIYASSILIASALLPKLQVRYLQPRTKCPGR